MRSRVVSYCVALLLAAVLVAVVCDLAMRRHTTTNSYVVQYDTVRVIERDTLTMYERIEHIRHHYDTIVVNDTVYVRDEPQRYADSTADYRLSINAVKLYDYTLDIYRADTFTQYIPKVPSEPTKRGSFGQSLVLGLQVGYGLVVSPATMQARFEPYIGIGLTYGLGFNW